MTWSAVLTFTIILGGDFAIWWTGLRLGTSRGYLKGLKASEQHLQDAAKLVAEMRDALHEAVGGVQKARAAMEADDERLRTAGERVGLFFGCDTPEWMADEILRLRARANTEDHDLLNRAVSLARELMSAEWECQHGAPIHEACEVCAEEGTAEHRWRALMTEIASVHA